jgi:hydroxymethylpyrimidine/phosphomethylpyrimidine kinase
MLARMVRHRNHDRPCVLLLAGLDPSGGAGLAADQRAVLAAGAWPCPAITVITVQSTKGLVAVHPVHPSLVLDQAREVLRHQRVKSIKTGALGDAENVRAVLQLLGEHPRLPVIVDPVIVATRTRGARLLDEAASDTLDDLLACATVVTPNVDEAELILGSRIRDEADLAEAAHALVARGARAALVKGGHLQGSPYATDVLAIGERLVRFRARRVKTPEFHGGGCTMASLIAGRLALVDSVNATTIVDAVSFAKRRLGASIRRSQRIGAGLRVLPL